MNTTSEQENTGLNAIDRTTTGQQIIRNNKGCKDQLSYWKGKLKKRTVSRDGAKSVVAGWQVRIFYAGKEIWFNTQTENRESAAIRAREFYESIVKLGWDQTLLKYKPKGPAQDGMTIDQFIELYRNTVKGMEDPPRLTTQSQYEKALLFVCRWAKVKLISKLDADAVDSFRNRYLADGRESGRDDASLKTSANYYIRSAGALFGKELCAAYAKSGYQFTNPFSGKQRGASIEAYTPLRPEMLESIWRNSATLRDGNPEASMPDRSEGHWKPFDARVPHPAAYLLLLLELGLGLRRNEADKAEWSWFRTEADGRIYFDVQETEFFTPKSDKPRTVPVDPSIFEAIQKMRSKSDIRFVVPGRQPKAYATGKAPKAIQYRCEMGHRALVQWLRMMGIEDLRCCHTLRKEFGSFIATSFGLYAAQKLLGHSSPKVTSDYYAGLTELPEIKILPVVFSKQENA